MPNRGGIGAGTEKEVEGIGAIDAGAEICAFSDPLHSENTRKVSAAIVRFALSYGVAAACLYWVLHDLRLGEIFRSLSRVNWWLTAPAVICQLLVYVCAGWEWQLLLRPVARLPMRRVTQAVLAGRFANDVLPVHAGYLVRLYLAARWSGAKIASIVPSLLIERLFDGLWLAIGIGWAAFYFPLPPRIASAAKIWAGIVGFGLAAGAVILLRRGRRAPAPTTGIFRWKRAQKIWALAGRLFQQIRAIGRSRLVWAALGVSILKLAANGLGFLFAIWAYGFRFPLLTQIAIFLVAYVGISIPSTPASAGVFQLFCVAGLEVFHAPKAAATGFALLAFVILNAPLLAAGFLAFGQSGLTLRRVRTEARQWRRGSTEFRN